MAADTVPAAVPDPTDPPAATPVNQAPQGAITSMFAAIDPARQDPDFDLAPAASAADGTTQVTSGNGSSDAYHGDEADHGNGNSGGGKSIQKQGIWRAWLLAGATRWGKGGGATNKRLDLAKVKAQRRQVKENRQVSINRSGGLLGNRPGGAGAAGSAGGGGKSLNSKNSGGNGPSKGPKNSNGSAHHGAAGHSGRSGDSGGGKSGGRSGGSGGSASGGGGNRGLGGSGRGPGGADGASTKPHKGNGGHSPKQPKPNKTGSTGGDQAKSAGGGKSGSITGSGGKSGAAGSGKDGKSGAAGASGKEGGAGKEGASGSTTGTGTANGEKTSATKGGTDGKKTSLEKKGKDGSTGKQGKDNRPNGPKDSSSPGAGTDSGKGSKTDSRTPLEKSRETGHGDGSKARRVVDHVRAWSDGVKDGWGDERDKNAKEHDRLDKAHAQHKAKLQGTTQGQTVQIEDDNEPMEDPFMSTATPIQAQGIDAKKLTLGEDCLKPSVTRGELRRFKDYEGRLESRIDALSRIADATKQLAAQAREQADDCQKLAEEAKGVKGGEKLIGQLQQLADKAKAQADEANEVHKRAARAHDFAKAVLSNIQTRYAPLYQAVVDSDEVKPAELKFYADRGVTRSDTALAA